MTNDEIKALVDHHAEQLGEQFDAVQILVTWNENGLTRDLFRGRGNVHARLHMAQDYITRDNAQQLAIEIQEKGSEES
jgi:hypothetical protein